MRLLYAIQLLIIHFLVSFTIGIMTDNLNYRFWTWVAIGVPVHLILAGFFLSKNKTKEICPDENEEIFDHLFIKKNKWSR